jgi:release factor glutamine methyltransferase
MHTVRDLIEMSTDYLRKKGIPHERRCVEELLAFTLKKKRIDLYMEYDRPVEKAEVDHFRTLLKRKGAGEPFEYITGVISFFGCTLALSPSVLIPRQETEILLTKATEEIEDEKKVFWDLCTGSGALGLGIKKARPKLDVTLSDISEKALDCARENAKRNALDVAFVHGDLLKPFSGKKAHYVFCNPPYVSKAQYQTLPSIVKNFEPKEALLAGETGYEFFERLARELPFVLHSGAKVFLEVGTEQGERVLEIFSQSCWKRACYEKDWAGHDRFFFLEFR